MIGKTILHYKIIEKLGEGGMGVVYLAEDMKLERQVAIKFLPHHITANEDERKRFEIEAKAAAALNHPNIATIHAIEEADNEMFLVMEYIEGRELKDIVKAKQSQDRSPIDFKTDENIASPTQIATQIAEGLQAAHKKGIVHRDIKSSNIMVTEEGKIKIMDFGLAKIGDGEQITKARSTIGTIAYMSPEQTRGEEIDNRTDIWSFGVVLYEMLTGELPFKGSYDQAIIYSILNEEPDSLNKIEAYPSLYKVVKNTLEKDFNRRYSDMSEIIADLKSNKVESESGVTKIAKIIKKLAILPFSNLMDDPQTNFLGFAIADQIIGAIAYSKNILVRPSSSIRKYQKEIVDIQKAGAELNVTFVLTGNYLKQDDVIRLNIELIDLETENMVWRESIQIKYSNVFELQDIVSGKVVDGLKVQFSDEERERMKPDEPQNKAAYELYLQAISFPFTIEGNHSAIKMLDKSTGLDPLYAPAYLELGIRSQQLSQVGSETSNALDQAEKALLKALSLKNDLLPALANLGLLYSDIGKHEEAHLLLIKALKINPNDAWLHFSLSYHYRYIGFLEESEKEIRIALSIDPKNPRFRSSIITGMFLGKYDEILEKFNLDSESPFTLNYLGEVAFRKGNIALALNYFNKAVQIKDEIGEFYFASSFIQFINGNTTKAIELNFKREAEDPADGEIWYEIARLYGLFSKPVECTRALKKSIAMGYLSYPAMQKDAFLDSVRYDQQVEELLSDAKMKYEELKKKLDTQY